MNNKLRKFLCLASVLMAMTGLYIIANYNLAAAQIHAVPIEAYIAYYNASAQAVLKTLLNVTIQRTPIGQH